MKWLDQLERRYHKYAIANLAQYLAGGMALVFVFLLLNPQMETYLMFSPQAVLSGQIWRLLTFIILPRTTSIIWIFFSVLFTYFVGRSLESYWGTFRFNVYFFIGVLGTMLVSIVFTLAFGFDFPVGNWYIYTSLFLALCTVAPDYEIRIYMILPVKLKYLGWFTAAGIILELITSIITLNVVNIVAIVVAYANYLLFFGPGLINRRKQKQRRDQFRQAHRQPNKTTSTRNRSRSSQSRSQGRGEVIQVAFHCCEVCGKTEVDDPNLEFRYCSKCDGRHEYCSEHILNHEHIKEEESKS